MTYRTPDPATTIARLTRECERLRGELAAAKRPRARWGVARGGWSGAAWLALGTALRGSLIAANGLTVWQAVSATIIVVGWAMWALLYLRREPAPSDGGGL